jgi:hypothetical protein
LHKSPVVFGSQHGVDKDTGVCQKYQASCTNHRLAGHRERSHWLTGITVPVVIKIQVAERRGTSYHVQVLDLKR